MDLECNFRGTICILTCYIIIQLILHACSVSIGFRIKKNFIRYVKWDITFFHSIAYNISIRSCTN